MGTRQEKAYRSMERHMAALLDTELLIAPNPLTKLIRLMQFASACGAINEVEQVVVRLGEDAEPPAVIKAALQELGR